MILDGIDPIVLVEDDLDDQDLIRYICKNLNIKNELIIFDNAPEAFDFLQTTNKKIFIILCDINLPLMDGIELRDKIQNDEALMRKAIPFVFLSTGATKVQVDQAYALSVQGFFLKATNFKELENKIRIIFEYWSSCITPNNIY